MQIEASMLNAHRFAASVTVREAIEQMLENRWTCAAVFHRRRLLGTVTLEGLVAHARTAQVGRVVEPVIHPLQLPCSLSSASATLESSGLQHLVVFDGPRFVGILTPDIVLKQSKFGVDPVTGLPWCGALRSWGAHHMEQGREISVLFLDLPAFKEYNRDRGYGEGDDLLKRVSDAIAECLDDDLDMLVRFSGDEFAVGTLRDREDAAQLAHGVVRHLLERLQESEREAVLPAIGITGGRRTNIRPGVNVAATLDNLIQLAKNRCAAA